MFTEDTPKIISSFFSIIDAVEQALKKSHAIERKSSQGELALYIKDAKGNSLLYFALRYDLWRQLQAPLWFGVEMGWGDQVAGKFSDRNKNCIEYSGFKLCPIDLRISSGDNAAEEIVSILQEQLAALSCPA